MVGRPRRAGAGHDDSGRRDETEGQRELGLARQRTGTTLGPPDAGTTAPQSHQSLQSKPTHARRPALANDTCLLFAAGPARHARYTHAGPPHFAQTCRPGPRCPKAAAVEACLRQLISPLHGHASSVRLHLARFYSRCRASSLETSPQSMVRQPAAAVRCARPCARVRSRGRAAHAARSSQPAARTPLLRGIFFDFHVWHTAT